MIKGEGAASGAGRIDEDEASRFTLFLGSFEVSLSELSESPPRWETSAEDLRGGNYYKAKPNKYKKLLPRPEEKVVNLLHDFLSQVHHNGGDVDKNRVVNLPTLVVPRDEPKKTKLSS
jgi:hypothetical protein